MKIDGYLFILLCYFFILISGLIISKIVNFKVLSNRFESIDGFRGLLATGVFIHHSIIWYNYLETKIWKLPENYFAIHLGQSSVAFFFMITSFLFTNKILKSNQQNFIFWKNLLYSRILRLCPLYFFIITICIFFTLIIDNFLLESSLYIYLVKCLKWYLFNIKGKVEIGQLYDIELITAGVTWSLPYEWLYYFSLPLLSLFFLKNKNYTSLFISLIFILLYCHFNTIKLTHILSFIGGMIPAFILHFKPKTNLDTKSFSIITTICLVIAFTFESSTTNFFSKILLIISFTSIALKNSLFGILKLNFLKYLGEISYSTYLIHGLLLFTTFYSIGFENVKKLSSNSFSILIFAISIILNIICAITFQYIEKPFIKLYNKKIKKIHQI